LFFCFQYVLEFLLFFRTEEVFMGSGVFLFDHAWFSFEATRMTYSPLSRCQSLIYPMSSPAMQASRQIPIQCCSLLTTSYHFLPSRVPQPRIFLSFSPLKTGPPLFTLETWKIPTRVNKCYFPFLRAPTARLLFPTPRTPFPSSMHGLEVTLF